MRTTRSKVGRSFLTRVLRIATTTMVVLAAIGFCATAFAQNPIPNPPQVGQQHWTIMDTGHDFGDGEGLLNDSWVGAGDNMCAPCHGVAGSGSSTPVWNHDVSSVDYSGTDWLYSRNDRVVTGAVITAFADGGGPSYHPLIEVISPTSNLEAGEKVIISAGPLAGEHEVNSVAAGAFKIPGSYDGEVAAAGQTWVPFAATTAPAMDDLSLKCLGCHDGTVFLQAYAGHVPQMETTLAATGAIASVRESTSTPPDAVFVSVDSVAMLAVGDDLVITDSTLYDGTYEILAFGTGNEVKIDAVFLGDDTGTWSKYVTAPVPDAYMTGDENLTTALAMTHHPIGVSYTKAFADSVGYLKDPTNSRSNPQGGSISDTLLNLAGDINCNSCHEQHNDRRFDLVGDSNKDNPEPGDTSEDHNFLNLLAGGCRVCHASGREAAAFTLTAEEDAAKTHHFPGRDDPWGDARNPGGAGLIFSCAKCHDLGDATTAGNHTHPCIECHLDYPVRDVNGEATMATGHHGASRHSPYTNCVACHADPVTGLLTGNAFGSLFAPSCFECHGELWFAGDTAAPTIVSINGQTVEGADITLYADQLSTLTAIATDPDSAEQPLSYSWSFGDGTMSQFPRFDNTTTHTYEFYNYNSHGDDSPIMTCTVAVTDGVNPPETFSVNLVVKNASSASGPDAWTVTVDGEAPFNITVDDHDGSLVVAQTTGDKKGQLSYGVQFGNVVFWMELWMDLGNNAYWGTGDMYFGNSDGSDMSGVVFRTDGSVLTFTAD